MPSRMFDSSLKNADRIFSVVAACVVFNFDALAGFGSSSNSEDSVRCSAGISVVVVVAFISGAAAGLLVVAAVNVVLLLAALAAVVDVTMDLDVVEVFGRDVVEMAD